MPGDPPEGIKVTGAGINPSTVDHQYPPPEVTTKAAQEAPSFVDGSGPIFSMYSERATEDDEKMAESWKADAEGILVFTGLFSAAVASLISVSIQDIRPNPQDTSNFYLSNIYQTLANPGSNVSSSLPTSPPSFSPPNYAIWVNALWFLSLVISITCALLATLLQRCARRYLKVTQPRYSPHKRARIRAFFFEGVDKFLVLWAVEALPTLLHVSLFLFFAGLAVFLHNVNLTIFKLVLSWVSICTALYGCITFIPILRHDSPYHTPLSLPTWYILTGLSFVTLRVLRWLSLFISLCYLVFCCPCAFCALNDLEPNVFGRFNDRLKSLAKRCHELLKKGMQKTVEQTALNSPSKIVTRAFTWTFDGSDEDHELERFFAGLPGFRSSKVVDDPLPGLTEEEKKKLIEALVGLLDRSFSSVLLPEHVKTRRAVICAKAINPAESSEPWFRRFLDRILSEDQYGPVQSSKIARFVRDWGSGKDVETNAALIQAIVSSVVARAQVRDDDWFALASDELGESETVLRDYAAHGDNLSLAILIHITRQQFTHFGKWPWPTRAFSKVLEKASQFNVQDASPDLRHKFCALWNKIVLKARNDNDKEIAGYILCPIQNIYIDLHRHTNSASTWTVPSPGEVRGIILFSESEPSKFPRCNVLDHHPDSTPQIHDDPASTGLALPAPHDNPAPARACRPSAPSVPAPYHVNENLTDVIPLDNDIYVPWSFHRARHTAIENVRIASTSQYQVTARVIQDGAGTSAGMIHFSTQEPSASTPPISMTPTSPPVAVAIQHITGSRPSLDVPDVPLLPSPSLVLFPTESHSSILAPTAHPRLFSAPDMDAPAEGEGSANVALKERAAHDSPSTIQENTIAATDLPPQSPSLSITDIAAADPSPHSLDVEHTGDHSPRPSYGQYDIV